MMFVCTVAKLIRKPYSIISENCCFSSKRNTQVHLHMSAKVSYNTFKHGFATKMRIECFLTEIVAADVEVFAPVTRAIL